MTEYKFQWLAPDGVSTAHVSLPVRDDVACESVLTWNPAPSHELDHTTMFTEDTFWKSLQELMEEQVFLDGSRRSFLHPFARSLYLMALNGKCDTSELHRLLIGWKGVGKTSLLRVLALTLPKAAPSFWTLFLDIGSSDCGDVTLDEIVWCAALHRNIVTEADRAADQDVFYQLAMRRRPVLIVLDEIQEAYKKKALISSVYRRGVGDTHACAVVITGSSPVTRWLCFREVDEAFGEAEAPAIYRQYPGYADASCLNSRKFQAVTLSPPLTAQDFALAVNSIGVVMAGTRHKEWHPLHDGDDDDVTLLDKLVKLCHGSLPALEKAVSHFVAHGPVWDGLPSLEAHEHAGADACRRVYTALLSHYDSAGLDVLAMTEETAFLPFFHKETRVEWKALCRERGDLRDVSHQSLTKLADVGLLQVESLGAVGLYVSFGHPGVFLAAHGQRAAMPVGAVVAAAYSA